MEMVLKNGKSMQGANQTLRMFLESPSFVKIHPGFRRNSPLGIPKSRKWSDRRSIVDEEEHYVHATESGCIGIPLNKQYLVAVVYYDKAS